MRVFIFILFCVVVYADVPKCDHPHEHYTRCGTDCPVTCSNLKEPRPDFCGEVCFRGCECDEGYYRQYDRYVGQCVKAEDCPLQQGVLTRINPSDPLHGTPINSESSVSQQVPKKVAK